MVICYGALIPNESAVNLCRGWGTSSKVRALRIAKSPTSSQGSTEFESWYYGWVGDLRASSKGALLVGQSRASYVKVADVTKLPGNTFWFWDQSHFLLFI